MKMENEFLFLFRLKQGEGTNLIPSSPFLYQCYEIKKKKRIKSLEICIYHLAFQLHLRNKQVNLLVNGFSLLYLDVQKSGDENYNLNTEILISMPSCSARMLNYTGIPHGANILVGETDSKTHIKYCDSSWQGLWRKNVKRKKRAR